MASIVRVAARCLASLGLVVAAAALLVLASPSLQAEAVFCHKPANLVHWLLSPCELGKPDRGRWYLPLGLLSCDGDVEAHRLAGGAGGIGVWHYRPSAGCTQRQGGTWVLYAHGNGETRAWGPAARKLLHLAGECMHAVSFDPRGFGDSDGVPSEQGVLDDGWRVLEWVAGQGPSSVLLIGHSLGAAVAVGIAARLCEEAAAPAVSLLLEGSPPPHGPRGRLSRARGRSREMAREQAPSPPFLTRPPNGSRWHRTRPRQ